MAKSPPKFNFFHICQHAIVSNGLLNLFGDFDEQTITVKKGGDLNKIPIDMFVVFNFSGSKGEKYKSKLLITKEDDRTEVWVGETEHKIDNRKAGQIWQLSKQLFPGEGTYNFTLFVDEEPLYSTKYYLKIKQES